jgi:microcin C transport system permease protein
MPVLYLLIILSAFIEPSFWWLLGLMLLFSWTALVGVVRAEFLRARNFDYVRAAKALGVSDLVIIWQARAAERDGRDAEHSAVHPVGLDHDSDSLDFLGFGLPPGSASLGEMITQGKAICRRRGSASPPSRDRAHAELLIFVGEAVRDAFDPRKTFR